MGIVDSPRAANPPAMSCVFFCVYDDCCFIQELRGAHQTLACQPCRAKEEASSLLVAGRCMVVES